MSEQRLIDANSVIEYIDMNHLRPADEICFSERDVVNMLRTAPAVDVMKVVLCDKCAIWGDCRIQKMWNVPRGFYCAWGKPIEKEKSDYTGDVTEMPDGRESHE